MWCSVQRVEWFVIGFNEERGKKIDGKDDNVAGIPRYYDGIGGCVQNE